MTKSYNKQFAGVYDEFVGDRANVHSDLAKTIKKYAPKARTVLELASGTGTLLVPLSKKYTVTGVDLSAEMLQAAKKKLPKATFLQGDAQNVDTGEAFDFAFMLFDSINHLKTLADWEKVFKNAQNNLKPGGLFLFDFNTKAKLDFLAAQPVQAKILQQGKVLATMKVSKAAKTYVWYIKLYKSHGPHFRYLTEEKIDEVAFPLPNVLSKFKKHFKVLKTYDELNKKPTKKSQRIYVLGQVI